MVSLHRGIFFKYIDIEGAKKSLKKGTFKFNTPSVTNDPFECYGGLISNDTKNEFVEQVIKDSYLKNKRVEKLKKAVDENHIKDALTKIVHDRAPDHMSMFNVIRDVFSIASFSRRNDIHLMWSYYAQNHQGICIGYSMEISEFSPNVFSLKMDYKRRIKPMPFFSQNLSETLIKWVTTKSFDWEHEKEVRLVDLSIKKRSKEKVIFKQYERKYLKKITFGINTPLKEIEAVIKIVKKYYPNQQVTYTKMVIGDKQFTLKEIPYIPTTKCFTIKKLYRRFKPKLPFAYYYFRFIFSRKLVVFLDKVLVFLGRLKQDK